MLREECIVRESKIVRHARYRPETERASHYFGARLSPQFDEYIWFDRTSATTPLVGAGSAPTLAAGHPFATLDV